MICARDLLVRRIHEGEQVADRDRIDLGVLQLARGAAHGVAVERREHRAGIVGALGDFAGEALRGDRLRLGIEIVEQVAVARLVLHLLHRAIALGDQQPDLGAAHLQQRIGGDRGAVREELDLARRDAARDEARQAVEHAERRVLRRARHLLDHEVAARLCRAAPGRCGCRRRRRRAGSARRRRSWRAPVGLRRQVRAARLEGVAQVW